MTEPILTYKKGEGWVYATPHYATALNGEKWLIEARPPQVGEYYTQTNTKYGPDNKSMWLKGGEVDLDQATYWVNRTNNVRAVSLYRGDPFPEGTLCVVFTEVK